MASVREESQVTSRKSQNESQVASRESQSESQVASRKSRNESQVTSRKLQGTQSTDGDSPQTTRDPKVDSLAPGITVSVDGDRVATILLDQPGTKVNVMNVQFIDELEGAIKSLDRELRGLVIASGKVDNFVAGADLHQLLQAETPEEASEQIRRLHRVLNRLSSLPFPSVAAINGPALGGGFELALACDYRVCVENTGNILGLPEVSLGLLPAGGGTQRLPALIGLSRALGLILEGKRYSPRRGKRYGAMDEVVHPAILIEAARALLVKGKRRGHPRWVRLDEAANRWPLVRTVIYRRAEQAVRKKTRGHYPAPLRALDAIRAGQEQGFGAGLAAEAVAFGELAAGQVAHNLIHIFLATEGLKRDQKALTSQALPAGRIGVIGAGFMGAGIAQAAAVAGSEVRVRDVKPEQVGRGLRTARDLTVGAARKGRFSRPEAQAIVSRLSGATDYSGLARADLVIEAVFEDIEVKRNVIKELEGVLRPDAVIASNTSSLPIGQLATGSQHPERIVGMHFFSPVHKMPLVEVIRAEQTSEQAVATVVEMGRRMGKTVIVVGDGPGFYTTRVVGFMGQEAGRIFEQGASIEDVDGAMTAFGFPVGPLALSDEVGLEVAAHVAEILGNAFPDRFTASTSIVRMVAEGRLGRKNKRGFYDYSARKKKPDVTVYALRAAPQLHLARELIQRRMVLSFVNEAARCLEEGIIASARDGDIGAIMGVGFPPFLGGPFRYADSIGIDNVVAQLKQLEFAYGATFSPAKILEEMAATGKHFYNELSA
jgi:3-hydroxyacyl-CoA dehydrogenase / enoyl-CoA hydratase / 3-hydroxybutyryl-CoA epimerase